MTFSVRFFSEKICYDLSVTYTVRDANGWTFNTVAWPKGKRLHLKGGYKTCKTPNGAKTYNLGTDQIKLVKGPNYFICNFVGHCDSATKIAINAL
ncbi:basic blue protein-like [Vigna umbellata]|uniref:basic blue protein-like n=1 Tax=Vigna umbellata TaxID=87088 RepID=UPI001F5FC00C|nr:basic blue protein-like [Vigna umbellata]